MTTIRNYADHDLDAVVDLWNRALVRDPISSGRFVAWLVGDADYWPGDDSGFFVAVRGQTIVGFLRAIIRRWPNDRVGLEPENGWIAALAVGPDGRRLGIGTSLVEAGLDYLRKHDRRRVWVCGNTGSAPGYIFPGVDEDAYAGALALFTKLGFEIDHRPVAMSGDVVDFDLDRHTAEAWSTGRDVEVTTLTPARAGAFMTFLAESFPGDWNIAARMKIRAGDFGHVLTASIGGRIVGYCQWDGEHFGPFGVDESARNRKIGAKLFVEAVRRIRAADGRSVWFNWADEGAARFYGRFGLEQTRRFAILKKEL